MEHLGGFRALKHDDQAQYDSSLAPNGRVSWISLKLEKLSIPSNTAEASLNISFPNVDWISLQSVYGWAAQQYQAWARGNLIIDADSTLCTLLYADNVLEFWVDGKHYFGGDYYAYRRAPLVLHLCPGPHRLEIRIIRDLRVMGSSDGDPSISIKLKAESSDGSLVAVTRDMLLPDVVNGTLAGSFASIPVRNESEGWVDIWNLVSLSVSARAI